MNYNYHIFSLRNDILRTYLISIYQIFKNIDDEKFAYEIIDLLVKNKELNLGNEEDDLSFQYDDNITIT